MANPFDKFDHGSNPFDKFDSNDPHNPRFKQDALSTDIAKADFLKKQADFQDRMKNDPYFRIAQEQNPVQNLTAGLGGVLYGLGNLGPRQIMGKASQQDYADWAQSMDALGSTRAGKIGAFGGYAMPAVLAAPLTGASVLGSAGTAGLESFLDPAQNNQVRANKTVLGTLIGAVGQKLANAIGNKAANTRASSQLASYPGAESVRDKTLSETLNAGYKLPPSAVGKQSLLESVSGQIKTQQAASDLNQPITDNLIRGELGDASKFGYRVTPNTDLTSQTMLAIRKAAGKPYDQIKKLGTFEIGKKPGIMGNPEVAEFDAASAVDNIKQLRHDGYSMLSSARASGDPETLAQAKGLLGQAGALEDSLDQALQSAGKEKLLTDLRSARQLIAKTYNIQDAIRESVGKVDARDMGTLFESGEKGFGPRLTGNLATVGKAGSAFKESMGMRGFDAPRYSALDFAMGGMNLASNTSNPVGLLSAGIPLLRGPARDRILSDSFQKTLIPNNTPPGMVKKALPYLFDYTPNIPMLGPYPASRTVIPAASMGGFLSYSFE